VSDWGNRLAQSYHASLKTVLNAPRRMATICVLAAASAAGLYTLLDQELLPAEDRGTIYLFAKVQTAWALITPSGRRTAWKISSYRFWSGVKSSRFSPWWGRWDPNNVFMLAKLADWRERERSQQEIAADLKPLFADLPGVTTRIFSANSLNLRGASSGGLSVALLGTDYDEIYAAAREYTEQIRSRLDSVSRPRIGYDPSQPQLSVEIDRERASDLNIPLEDVHRLCA
jgi:multidrug efflux pump subunit AcrB